MKKHYPYSKFDGAKQYLQKVKIPSQIIFIIIGTLSAIWFLVRVIPKPQRAAYPCMKAAAPWASAFVIYLLGLTLSAFSIKKFLKNLAQAKHKTAFMFLTISILGAFFIIPFNRNEVFSANDIKTTLEDPNTPIGTAKGIFPGRVVWVMNKKATNENCTNTYGDGYFMDKNTDQVQVDAMLKEALFQLTNEKTISGAWDKIFKYHNTQRGKGNLSYQNDEIIFLKINATSSWGGNFSTSDLSRASNTNYAISETSPQLVTSVLRHLVNELGVSQSNIYIGDPLKHIYKDNYEKWHGEFPDIHYLDNSYSTLGREKVTKSTSAVIDYSDRGNVLREGSWESALDGDPVQTDYLYTIFEEMDYMINLPTLKGHIRAGVTMFAKNHFGSHTRDDAKHLHGGLVKISNDSTRNDYKMYRVLVDIMGHELTGKKNLIYLMDALYCSDHEVDKPDKFLKSPWNNDWTSSIFISQDPVAIESVGFDVLYYEMDGTNGLGAYPHYGAVDDYLHQAADESNWPTGIIYDPENDGSKLASLGVHEHWNNSTDRQYSRNLGTGDGIELIFKEQNNMTELGNYTTDNSELPSNQVNTIYIDSSHTLWVGTDAGLSSVNNGQWKHYDTILFHHSVNDIVYEKTQYGKEIWVATDSGLTVAAYTDVDGITSATTYFPENSALVGHKIAAVEVDIVHNRWVGTDSALCVFRGQTWDSLLTASDANGDNFPFYANKITDIKSYKHDSLALVATHGKGIVRMKYEIADGFTGASTYALPWAAIVSDTITAIDVDKELQWYGTNLGAQKHKTNLTKDDWILFNTDSGILDNNINTVHIDKNHYAWIGTSKGISIILEDGGIYELTEDDGLIHNQVNCISDDIDGNIWVATSGGVQWFSGVSGTQTILGSPELISPENYQKNADLNIDLSWSGVIGAESYNIQVATDKNFSDLIINLSEHSQTSYSLSDLEGETDYYWKVQAKNGSLTSDWSAEFYFTTKRKTSLEHLFSVKANIKAYPNPAKENLYISVQPDKEQMVKIEMYDMNGRLIEIPLEAKIPTSGFEFELNLIESKYPKGIYLIKISGESFMKIEKININ
jgi:hypothetical protein